MSVSIQIPPGETPVRSFSLAPRTPKHSPAKPNLKGKYQASFYGYTYSPFNPTEIAMVAGQLLDFATERYLWDGYEPFILNVLADYPEFKLDTFDPLDSALLTAYAEGFYYPEFSGLLSLIREDYAIPLDYANSRLVTLIKATYEWSNLHAGQFKDTAREGFTRAMQANPAAPGFAFLLACTGLDLPFDKWARREAKLFSEEFSYYLKPAKASSRNRLSQAS